MAKQSTAAVKDHVVAGCLVKKAGKFAGKRPVHRAHQHLGNKVLDGDTLDAAGEQQLCVSVRGSEKHAVEFHDGGVVGGLADMFSERYGHRDIERQVHCLHGAIKGKVAALDGRGLIIVQLEVYGHVAGRYIEIYIAQFYFVKLGGCRLLNDGHFICITHSGYSRTSS